jgi:protein SCO1/2
MKMNKLLSLIIIALSLAIVFVMFVWEPAAKQQSHSMPQAAKAAPGGAFTLQSITGDVSLQDFKGKVVLVYFGYTMCPDVCPTNLSIMANAFMQLENSGFPLTQVQGIFISVDPKRDTLKRLQEYTGYFHPNIIGLTSTPEIIKEVADRYGAVYRAVVQDSATNYVVDHSSETYVVDTNGRLVERLAHATPPEQIIASIKKYVQ